MIDLAFHKNLKSALGLMTLEVNTQIEKGQFVTLYGKSGAGKTSVLRVLAGLMDPDSGTIKSNGDLWFDSKQQIKLPPQKRKVGMVFQDYALFPNMTVRQNLQFALETNEENSIIEELIEIIELGNLSEQKPEKLSGGQKQRVALARALVQKPQLLLLDEPLSALDVEIRAKLQQYIQTVHKEFQLTTILVSHDISEILRLSDQIIEIEEGKIINQGTPLEVFGHHEVSGKFQFTGEVLSIDQQEVVFVITILIGKEIVRVVADHSEANALKTGDKVLVASKAFNPIIRKIEA